MTKYKDTVDYLLSLGGKYAEAAYLAESAYGEELLNGMAEQILRQAEYYTIQDLHEDYEDAHHEDEEEEDC